MLNLLAGDEESIGSVTCLSRLVLTPVGSHYLLPKRRLGSIGGNDDITREPRDNISLGVANLNPARKGWVGSEHRVRCKYLAAVVASSVE